MTSPTVEREPSFNIARSSTSHRRAPRGPVCAAMTNTSTRACVAHNPQSRYGLSQNARRPRAGARAANINASHNPGPDTGAAAGPPQRASRPTIESTTPVDGHHGRPYNFALSSTWGHSSAGRAPAWHAGGRRFDPAWLHQVFRCTGRTENGRKKGFTASPSSRGLGHYPFTVATGVRIPVGTPLFNGPGHSGPIFLAWRPQHWALRAKCSGGSAHRAVLLGG